MDMSKTKSDKLVFGHYLMAFVDLLGQREKLKYLNALLGDEAVSPEVVQKGFF